MIIWSFPLDGTLTNVPESHFESLFRVLKAGAVFGPLLVKICPLIPTQLSSATLLAFRLPGDFPALASVSPSVKMEGL